MFVFFCFKVRATTNAANRSHNTVPHHGGGRTFERHYDIAAAEHPEGNHYVDGFTRVYPTSFEDQVNI